MATSRTRRFLLKGPTAPTPTLVEFFRKRNISTVLVRPEVIGMGSPDANGIYNGLIGLLQNDEADFSAHPLATNLPGDPIESTTPVVVSKGTLLQNVVTKEGHAIDFLEQWWSAYQGLVWTTLGTFILVVAALLCLAESQKVRAKYWLAYFWIWTLARATLVQHADTSMMTKQRVLYYTLIVATMFAIITATCSIGTKFVVKENHIVTSLTELLEQSENTKVDWWEQGYTLSKFKDTRSPDSVYEKFGKDPKKSLLKLDHTNYLNSLLDTFGDQDYIVLDEQQALQALVLWVCWTSQQKARMKLTKVDSYTVGFAHGYNKKLNETYKKWIKDATQKVMTSGFTDRMFELFTWWNFDFKLSFRSCSRKESNGDVSGLRSIKPDDYEVTSICHQAHK